MNADQEVKLIFKFPFILFPTIVKV